MTEPFILSIIPSYDDIQPAPGLESRLVLIPQFHWGLLTFSHSVAKNNLFNLY